MIEFIGRSWDDYLYFKQNDKHISKKIDSLIKDCLRNPFEGIGKPEPLKGELSGFWSRRINKEHRFVYRYEDNKLLIFSCRYHYKK